MPAFELALIVLTLLLGLSIVWSTLIVGMSPMPSSKKARKAMMALVDVTGDGPIVDLGSGWGGLMIALALEYPNRQVVGYELSIVPWIVAVLTSKALGLKNIRVYRQNFLEANLPAGSVVVCYLHPAAMIALEAKQGLNTKLTEPHTTIRYVISNNFALPSFKAEETIRLNDFYQSCVYRYRIND